MQETKRRGKKGVILLALVVALLVMAIVPAVASAAAGSVKVNGVDTAIKVGALQVNLAYAPDTTWTTATQVKIQDRVNGGSFTPSSPAFVAGVSTNGTLYTLASRTPATVQNGDVFEIRVTWYTAAGISLGSYTSAILTYDNSRAYSVLSTLPYSSYPFMNNNIEWFGPNGLVPFGSPPARGDFSTNGATPESINYRVDGGSWVHLAYIAGVQQWVNPVALYNGPINGIHTVDHFAVAAGTNLTSPVVTNQFGWDSWAPKFDPEKAGIDSTKWYGKTSVAWATRAYDDPGSGVETATATFAGVVTPGTRLEWDWYQQNLSGSITATSTYDAINVGGPMYLTLSATDYVNNNATVPVAIKFDLTAPHTSWTSDPLQAATEPPVGPAVPFIWTNKPVTVTFVATDPGAPTLGSGVAYTEYYVGTTTETAPGTPKVAVDGKVVINNTAPTGPVVLWFRSVDKANPANTESWQKIFVYFDNVKPVLSDDAPTWWVNAGGDLQVMPGTVNSSAKQIVTTLTGFPITITAYDPNSGIAPPGIHWMIDGHPPYGATVQGDTAIAWVAPLGLGDGIRNLSYYATDRAGNRAEATTTIKIDTRAPVTDGAAGWINGTAPYVLTATDQVPGSGVAATVYRVDQKTPWSINAATTVAPTLATSITWTSPKQGDMHTVDFASVDAALPWNYDATVYPFKVDGTVLPSWHFGNWELDVLNILSHGSAYKSRTVQLDVTAPSVTAMDPKNGEWQKGPGVVNFSGTDVGAGYAYTEWSTDGGTTWTKGETASIGGNGEITVTYHGVDKVGIKSADQTIVIKVASTGPSVVGANASAKKGQKATFSFNVTSVTPQVRVIIQIRTKSGRTISTHNYANVAANSDQTRSFKVNYPKGKYNIRISAVDQAGNNQTMRGTGTLTVK